MFIEKSAECQLFSSKVNIEIELELILQIQCVFFVEGWSWEEKNEIIIFGYDFKAKTEQQFAVGLQEILKVDFKLAKKN